MAINVNTVYRTVLLILNKEQRGMLTPDEFNKVATQVQLQIFEEYFNTLGQQVRRPDNVTEYGDQIKNTNHDISVFKEYGTCQYNGASGKFTLPSRSGAATYSQTFTGTGTISSFVFTSITVEQLNESNVEVFLSGSLASASDYVISGNTITFNTAPSNGVAISIVATPEDFYMLGSVIHKDSKEVQLVQRNELMYLKSNPLVAPTTNYPVFLYEDNLIQVLPPTITSDVSVSYLRKPMDVRWNFTIPNGQSFYQYNASGSINFELSKSEQTNIVTRILLYAGVVVRDPSIIQIASQQAQADTIKETL